MKKSRWLRILGNLDMAVAAVMLAVLTFVTSSGVFMRYVVNRPYLWQEEIQMFCMVWIVFCGAGVAFRTGSHVAIEMVVDALPKKARRVVNILIDIVVTVVLLYLFKQMIGYIQMFVKSGRSTPILKIPFAFTYTIAPISCFLMLFSYYWSKYVSPPDKLVEAEEGGDQA